MKTPTSTAGLRFSGIRNRRPILLSIVLQTPFTAKDMKKPLHCGQCSAHTPRSVLQQYQGYCASCGPGAIFHTVTGLGHCPQCGSRNVVDVIPPRDASTPNALRAAGAALVAIGVLLICTGIGFFLIAIGIALWVVGLVLPAKPQASSSRSCRYCGCQWLV